MIATILDNMQLFDDEIVVIPNPIHGLIHISNPVGTRRRRAPAYEESFG